MSCAPLASWVIKCSGHASIAWFVSHVRTDDLANYAYIRDPLELMSETAHDESSKNAKHDRAVCTHMCTITTGSLLILRQDREPSIHHYDVTTVFRSGRPSLSFMIAFQLLPISRNRDNKSLSSDRTVCRPDLSFHGRNTQETLHPTPL